MERRTDAGSDPRHDDLASIVLARHRAVRGPLSGWEDVVEAHPRQGYDARSVLVLVIVVAALAAVVGWTMTAGRSLDGSDSVGDRPAGQAEVEDAAAATAASKQDGAPPAPSGIALRDLRIERTPAGVSLVQVKARNHAARAAAGGDPVEVLVLIDGERVGAVDIPALPGRTTKTAQLQLGSCPAGEVMVTAILDPVGASGDRSTRDNVIMRSGSFSC